MEQHDLILHDPLLVQDGGFHIRLAGEAVPLLMHGEIVPHFLPGWRASHLYTGFAPLFLLELIHDDGRQATWFLDYRMHHVGDSVAALSGAMIDLLRLKAVPVMGRLLYTTLHQCQPALDGGSAAFLSVNEATRHAIAIHCLDFLIRPPAILLAEQLMPASLMFRGEKDDALRAIRGTHLAAGMAEDFQDRLAPAFREGVLAWPSPVDGKTLHAQGCFCFDDFHFAYRFADIRHGLVFFVMVAGHYSRVGGLWFPSLGLMVSHDAAGAGLAHQMLQHMPYWFATHSCQHAAILVPYLQRGALRFASVMRGRPGVHIGHQLWNELSGIDHLLERGPEVLPEWIVLDASDGIELYGPVDELFPALKGRVNRDLADIPALIRYTYTQGIMVVRVTREHVSERLRARILERVRLSAACHQARAMIGEDRSGPAILLGLRVENRTLVEFEAFLIHLVGFIIDRFPGAVLVIDGHNARGNTSDGRVIESHGEAYAGRRPVDVEHDLVATLRKRFGAAPVLIIDTIGQPISVSLAWADNCDCFVSIWGASLAKYRWVCNKPGLVVSSHHNLLHRSDLHIYDAPLYMDTPSPLEFVDPALVTDQPDAALLVDVAPGQASFANYRVDESELFPQIGRMILDSQAGKFSQPFPGVA